MGATLNKSLLAYHNMIYNIILANAQSHDTLRHQMTWGGDVKTKIDVEKKNLSKSVGALIAIRRKMLGLTQGELAERVDIEQESMSRIETGAITPSLGRLVSLADALDCPVETLLRPASHRKQDQVLVIAELLNELNGSERAFALAVVKDFVSFVKTKK
jgi:transcriptional regulator with XRE-family HTH domain